jgi:hypothetical protein
MSLSLKRGLPPEQSWGVFWHILIKRAESIAIDKEGSNAEGAKLLPIFKFS